jgi:SM-20-related protein
LPPKILAIDDVLTPEKHEAIWQFLRGPGWSFGAMSSQHGSRYFYKHFAGYQRGDGEYESSDQIEAELEPYPLLAAFWAQLKGGPLANHALSRCYANAMAPGVGGALHQDSNDPDHLTAIYYPHPTWSPDLAGETIFYSDSRDEVSAAVYPKPNRLLIFSGTIPHAARAMSSQASDLRITLMFKTLGPRPQTRG